MTLWCSVYSRDLSHHKTALYNLTQTRSTRNGNRYFTPRIPDHLKKAPTETCQIPDMTFRVSFQEKKKKEKESSLKMFSLLQSCTHKQCLRVKERGTDTKSSFLLLFIQQQPLPLLTLKTWNLPHHNFPSSPLGKCFSSLLFSHYYTANRCESHFLPLLTDDISNGTKGNPMNFIAVKTSVCN